MGQATPCVRIADARHKLLELDRLTGQSARRCDEIVGRFEQFAARAFGADDLDGATEDVLRQFVCAKSNGREPSIATMHLRRSVLRLLFRVAHEAYGFDADPTRHIRLAPRTSLTARPLTNEEVALGRSYSLHTLAATRQPAAWALAEATATTGELPHITVHDLDIDNQRVWLHGSRKREARWGQLSDWGVAQLQRRASSLRNTEHLVYQGSGSEESEQASCCIAIRETLIRAGLDAESDVRPASLVAWAGAAVFEETGKIEEVALRLGVRSLDAAARFIGFDWKK